MFFDSLGLPLSMEFLSHEPVPPLTLEKILKESHAAKRASHKDIIKADINSIRSMDEYTNRKKGMLMRMDPTDPKNAEGIKFLQDEVASQASQRQHRINSLRGAFKNRPKVGPIETVIPGKKVSDLIKHHIGIEHLQEIMRESGHDAIIHMGDRSGRAPHQVAIAYHPHQEYKPWIAPTIKPLLKEGSTAKNGIPLIANAILARQGRRHEER